MKSKRIIGLILAICLLLMSQSLVSAAVVFSDNFESGTYTNWNTQNGTWSIVTDGTKVFQQSDISAEGRAWAKTGSSTNQSVEAKVKVTNFNGSNMALVCARMLDGNNYYAVAIKSGTMELRKKISGSSTVLTSKSYTFSLNTWYTIKLEVSGTTLTAYVNGASQLTATTTGRDSGVAGLIAWKAAVRYDDVVVDDLGGGGTTPVATPTNTNTPTPSAGAATPTNTNTPTPSAGAATPTNTNTPTPSAVVTPTNTPTPSPGGNTYYVSPSGSDSNPGTITQPFLTIGKAHSVATAGTTIYLRGGTYAYSAPLTLTKSGSSGNLIKLWGYSGEQVVLDFSSEPYANESKGVVLTGSYWHFRGFTFKNSGDNGIYITTANNILERLVAYGHKDTGIQVYGSGASNNQVINCDSYDNYDPNTGGGKADGFGCKSGIGNGNVFRGCRAWHNSDDGFDFWETTVRIEITNCWAFDNGYDGGNGNGIKLGGNYKSGNIYVANCMVFNQPNKGFDQNHNTGAHTLYNNIAWKCGVNNFSLGEAPTSGNHVLKNNISFEGGQSIVSGTVQDKNSWQGFTVTSADFQSLTTSAASAARKSDGSLPDITLLHLVQGSDLVNTGVNVGLPYNGSAPDLGAFETSY